MNGTAPSVGAARTRLRSRGLQMIRTIDADAPGWSVIFEYELPLEGGRRPDVVVLAGDTVVALEFKTSSTIHAGDLDQTRAYAQDLADYHKESHGRRVIPILVLTGAKANAWTEEDGTIVVGPDALARYLVQLATEGTIDRDRWLESP